MKIPPQGCGVFMLDLDRAPNRPQTTRSGTACAAPAPNWYCYTPIWSRFQMPSKWAFHPTWAAVDALPGLTGRTRNRSCPGKLIPVLAVLISLFLSSAVTSKMQFRRPSEACGSPGRRPMLARGDNLKGEATQLGNWAAGQPYSWNNLLRIVDRQKIT